MTAAPIALPSALAASLHPLQLHDAVAWSAYLNRPGVIEHTSWGDISPAAIAALIGSYAENRDALRWAIVDTSGRLLGTPMTLTRFTKAVAWRRTLRLPS
ncbi:hypothetical protein G6F65_022578 [Rhizopus arrhizus]|nr:hypothetical protein G6F65_022578 [Rhizopus arrhizus]